MPINASGKVKVNAQHLCKGFMQLLSRQKHKPPIRQEMKALVDTKGSLTLQPLTAIGIHNLPAMNPVADQEGFARREAMEGNSWGEGRKDPRPKMETRFKAFWLCLP
ncbi:hypothetical protein MHYP_G00137700 [Metynnis hypsauchen]